jgi:DNA polymerase
VKVVHARGSVPCDVLFVGEAPGASENLIGRPFVGPAGKVQDSILREAVALEGEARFLYANVLGCIPLGGDGAKEESLPPECVAACRPRLEVLMRAAGPRAVVALGREPYEYLTGKLPGGPAPPPGVPVIMAYHPAAVLRAGWGTKDVMIRKNVVAFADAIRAARSSPCR